MSENEMLNCLHEVWENMTEDKDRTAYEEMLLLLDEMHSFLRYDLQIDYRYTPVEIKTGEFTF